MTRLATAALLVAGCLVPQMPAYSQDAIGDESIAPVTKKLDSILWQLRLIEKRLPLHETERLAFDFAKPIRESYVNGSLQVEWKPLQKLPALIDLQKQECRTKVDPSIDAGMLLDGYQRNLQRLR